MLVEWPTSMSITYHTIIPIRIWLLRIQHKLLCVRDDNKSDSSRLHLTNYCCYYYTDRWWWYLMWFLVWCMKYDMAVMDFFLRTVGITVVVVVVINIAWMSKSLMSTNSSCDLCFVCTTPTIINYVMMPRKRINVSNKQLVRELGDYVNGKCYF